MAELLGLSAVDIAQLAHAADECSLCALPKWLWEDLLLLFRPLEGAKYCDECVCLFVCLSVRSHISNPHSRTSPTFLCILIVVLVRSSSGDVAICYVLPVCAWRHVFT